MLRSFISRQLHCFHFNNVKNYVHKLKIINGLNILNNSMRIAIASKGESGLKDVVSNVFGRANAFTIVEVENEHIKNVSVVKNPGLDYTHGSGPIAVKTLVDLGVKAVIASDFGPNASSILQQHGVSIFKVERDISVEDALKRFIREKP